MMILVDLPLILDEATEALEKAGHEVVQTDLPMNGAGRLHRSNHKLCFPHEHLPRHMKPLW
jgi:hypothetical protein